MERKFCFTLILAMAAFFLMSCASDAVLLSAGSDRVEGLIPDEGESAEVELVETAEDGTPVIMVHICGQVMKPGVYLVPVDSRVYQVVELAGGFSPEAAESYLNLAETVVDGQKLVVPSLDQAQSDVYGQHTENDGESGLININTAGKELLMTLPGIGETKALAIIAWRTENGSFQTTEEIMQVPGIKEAAYEKIKSLITAP